MAKVRANSLYTYSANGYDLWDPKSTATEGQTVRVVNLPGCPPANTMGCCHVQDLGGTFLGLVCTSSLTKAAK